MCHLIFPTPPRMRTKARLAFIAVIEPIFHVQETFAEPGKTLS